jgi:virulence-associated protein VagC
MVTAKTFRSRNSQTVQLPKEFHAKSTELQIFLCGDEIILREMKRTMPRAFELLASLPSDLMHSCRAAQ